MTVKSSVSLTDEQHAFAKSLVEAGHYSSIDAVLQRGVELLRQQVEAKESENAALRALLSRRRESEFVTGTEIDARLATLIANKHRAYSSTS